MIESNNQEINVDELMEKIREEVANRNHNFQSQLASNLNSSPEAMDLRISNIEALLRNAESRSIIRTKWPDKLNRFPFNLTLGIQKIALKILNFVFKDQREVNFNLINALKQSMLLNHQLLTEIKGLRSHLNKFSGVIETHFNEIDNKFNEIDNKFNEIDNKFNEVNKDIKRLDGRYEIHLTNDAYIKNDLGQQKRLITMFLEEARKRLPEPFNQKQLQNFINEEKHLLDSFYLAFEDRFRGSREDIVNRLKIYLPLIEEAKVGIADNSILDLGCGRGEWLELLQNSGYIARGIDINRVMLEQCRSRGLEVMESDAIAYLQSLPDSSFGAITGFHIIEHLPFEKLIKLLTETIRVLKPKGLVIFETPNPENILVGSHNFYMDPTHRNPLPPLLTKFILENAGFAHLKIINLHPYPDSLKVNGSEISEQFNRYFYGPQDYAVVGYKL